MGTNYYWHDSPCGHCGRRERVHVGKSMHIWRGYPHRLFNERYPEWGYDPASPFGFPVVSIEDWRKVFTERQGQLFTEYGTPIDDPLAWLEGATRPSPYLRAEYERHWDAEWNWYDPAGFYFAAYEFS